MDTMFTIYKLNDISEIDGLEEIIDELDKINTIKIKNEHIPAVSDYFGNAMNFILSESIETILTIYALGQIIQSLIKIIKKRVKNLV